MIVGHDGQRLSPEGSNARPSGLRLICNDSLYRQKRCGVGAGNALCCAGEAGNVFCRAGYVSCRWPPLGVGEVIDRSSGEKPSILCRLDASIRACWPCSASKDPLRARSCASSKRSISYDVSCRPLLRASWSTLITVLTVTGQLKQCR